MFEKGKFIVLGMFIFLFSCKSNNYTEVVKRFKIEEQCLKTLKDSLVKTAQDTINDWVNDSLIDVQHLRYSIWKIDSVMVFNKDKSKSIGLILKSYINREIIYKNDDITYLLCENKGGKWYFFLGSTMILLRKHTTGDVLKPTSIGQLSEIGSKELLLSSYIRPWPWSENLIVNERIFEYGYVGNFGTEIQKQDWINRVGRRK